MTQIIDCGSHRRTAIDELGSDFASLSHVNGIGLRSHGEDKQKHHDGKGFPSPHAFFTNGIINLAIK